MQLFNSLNLTLISKVHDGEDMNEVQRVRLSQLWPWLLSFPGVWMTIYICWLVGCS